MEALNVFLIIVLRTLINITILYFATSCGDCHPGFKPELFSMDICFKADYQTLAKAKV
jgi:hypothetical protein